MKKLTLCLLLFISSMVAYANDLTYYDSDRLLNQSVPGKKIAVVIQEKFKSQQASIDTLTGKIKDEESQLVKYSELSQKGGSLSDTAKNDYNKLVNSYKDDLSKLSQLTQVYNSQKSVVLNYANAQLNILASQVVKSYALSNNLQAVYKASQFGYVDNSFDITNKLLTQLNGVDIKEVVSAIQTSKVGLIDHANAVDK